MPLQHWYRGARIVAGMLNQSAEYALRAMLFMAQGGAGAYKAPDIASALGLPNTYLSKVMHQLVKAGVLRSVRGPTGGYTLAREAGQISLQEIASPFQAPKASSQCLLGNRACDRSHPCAAHGRWLRINDAVASHLNNTTLADMLKPEPHVEYSPSTLTEVA
jgi:Rrf2 family transcriptional regulator, iron-sulfur cluster assembly transcription factor